MDSPYDVLDVDPDADDEELVRAYRERVKEAHPDQGGSTREFQRVREAYERIRRGETESASAPERRRREESTSERATGPSRREPGSRAPGGATDPDEQSEASDPNPTASRVEYVDYEVLDDHGWSVEDDDLFEKAAAAGLDDGAYGEFHVQPHEALLEAAEDAGLTWPYACRGGACANCAVLVVEGELLMPVDHILPDDLEDRGVRLSCNAVPLTDELRVVWNVKHRPELEELRLPPGPFELAQD